MRLQWTAVPNHPALEDLLPEKRHLRAHIPGALAKVNAVAKVTSNLAIPLVDANAIEWAILTSHCEQAGCKQGIIVLN